MFVPEGDAQKELRQFFEAESMDHAIQMAEDLYKDGDVQLIEEYPLSPTWEQRHFNAIAKEIRELFPNEDGPSNKTANMVRRGAYAALALSLAHRFRKDNPKFDVMKFLGACSPDNERFPITELWEDEKDEGTDG